VTDSVCKLGYMVKSEKYPSSLAFELKTVIINISNEFMHTYFERYTDITWLKAHMTLHFPLDLHLEDFMLI
jgi:hypothetical protein